MIDAIKNHIKAIIGSISLIAALIGTVLTFDSRYAHAADVDKVNSETKKIIQETTSNLRRQSLEDKLFEIDVRKSQNKITPIDVALRERYQRQLNELDKK